MPIVAANINELPKGDGQGAYFAEVLHNVELLRLNFGVLVLHAAQTALFLVVPPILEAGGGPVVSHWKVYLPATGGRSWWSLRPSWWRKNAEK